MSLKTKISNLGTIKVGSHDTKIKFPYVFKERTDLEGQYDKPVSEIRIMGTTDSGVVRTNSEIMVTLLHELFHNIDFCTGHMIFLGEEGEKYLSGLSEGWAQVIKDNPNLIDVFKEFAKL